MTKPRKPPATKTTKPVEQPKKIRKARAAKQPTGADPLVRMLPCPLTEAEREARAMTAASLGVEIAAEVKRIADNGLAAQRHLREMREKMGIMQQQAVDGTEMREVKCEELPRMDDGKIVLIRCDTGEYVEDLRPITAADLNGNLFEDK